MLAGTHLRTQRVDTERVPLKVYMETTKPTPLNDSEAKSPVSKGVSVDFVRLESIISIIRACIWTGLCGDEKPVSLMLVAEQESAKTEMLKYFYGTRTLAYISDLTSKGLSKHKTAIEDGKIRHLVLLDLVRIIAHARHVQERTFQTLAALMEEGESETLDAGGSSSWKDFPRIGVLCAITPAFFKSKRGKWRETGFLSRFLPVSFAYTEETVHSIHTAIGNGHKLPKPRAEIMPDFPFVTHLPEKYKKIIIARAEVLGQMMSTHGFRYQRALRALVKAQARIEGKGQVEESHVAKVIMWSEFFTEKRVEL